MASFRVATESPLPARTMSSVGNTMPRLARVAFGGGENMIPTQITVGKLCCPLQSRALRILPEAATLRTSPERYP